MPGEGTGDIHLQRGQAHPDVASVSEEGQAAVVEGHSHLQTGTGGGAHARGCLGGGKGKGHTGGHGMCTIGAAKGAEDWPLPCNCSTSTPSTLARKGPDVPAVPYQGVLRAGEQPKEWGRSCQGVLALI